mgnify:CR=1 FL=1
MVGDSITNLYGTTDTWPALTGNSHAGNYGVPSNNTSQMLARMPGILRNKPRAVFLMGGVNDLTTGVSTATGISNVQSMIALCQEAGVPIYVLAILRVTSAYPNSVSFNASIDSKNSAFQSAVTAAGATWIDFRNNLLDAHYQGDGIHVAHAGNVIWAASIEPYTSLYP